MFNSQAKIQFFDRLAERWDSFSDPDEMHAQLLSHLQQQQIKQDATIIDLGCGTGCLSLALATYLGPQTTVLACDISPLMLKQAKTKINDPRFEFKCADAHELPVANKSCDYVLCFSAWPHFDDPLTVAKECFRALKANGSLHIWHNISRQRVNEIHHGADPSIQSDLLPPAQKTADILSSCGFNIERADESDVHYLVVAHKASEDTHH